MKNKNDIKTSATNTIQVEIDGLKDLHRAVNDDWADTIDLLSKISGRVIVSGIGKSGHIARKIASTLASTGTPSQFVHSAEAAHGDLGMITKNDALLVLSWSGETTELKAVLDYSRRFAILLVALTANPESALGKAADRVLTLPPVKEAGAMGLAPTTSTTLQLVAGDAIAIALLEQKGFDKNNFRQFHPGGALGAQLKHVGELMHTKMPLCETTTPMTKTLLEMSSYAFGAIGVLAQDRLVGIITDGDLRRHMTSDLLNKTAQDVMTANPKTTTTQTLASSALEQMQKTKITALFVVQDNKPCGIIHLHDFLRAGVI